MKEGSERSSQEEETRIEDEASSLLAKESM
jgi:hypothetical protein